MGKGEGQMERQKDGQTGRMTQTYKKRLTK